MNKWENSKKYCPKCLNLYIIIGKSMMWYDIFNCNWVDTGGSSTVHIYKQYTEQHNRQKQYIEQHN